MPRVMVIADSAPEEAPLIVLNEYVRSVHVTSEHAAAQLLERVGWAIQDAEEAAMQREAAGGVCGRLHAGRGAGIRPRGPGEGSA